MAASVATTLPMTPRCSPSQAQVALPSAADEEQREAQADVG